MRHEELFRPLHEAMVRTRVLPTLRVRPGLSSVVIRLTEQFNGVYTDMMKLHKIVACDRCHLELEARQCRDRVLSETTTVVGTAGAVSKASAMLRVKKLAGAPILGAILLDEETQVSAFHLQMLLFRYKSWVNRKVTKICLAGAPSVCEY